MVQANIHQNNEELEGSVIVVRSSQHTETRQKLPQFVGISEATAGASGISMNLLVIPPGGAAEPHFHLDHETAIYIVEGKVETRYGPGLRQSIFSEAGDFMYIAPNVPHQPVNLSDTEPAKAVVARTDANEQERVIRYDPDGDS